MSKSAYHFKRHDNGIYYFHWTEDRREKRKSTGQKELAAAEVYLAEYVLMERTAVEEDRRGASLTVGDMWPIYIEKRIEGRPSATTVKSLSKNLLDHFGHLTVSDVSQTLVDDYVRKRTTGKLGKKSKPNSCRKELLQLNACLRYCGSGNRKGPKLFEAALFEGFDKPPEAEPRSRWLRHNEIDALHEAAKAMRKHNGSKRLTRLQRFLWLALETAGREMSLRELTWDRVDWEGLNVDLYNPARPRTSKKSPIAPLSDSLLEVLKQAYKERETKYVLDHPGKVWESVQFAVIRAGLDPKQTYPVFGTPKATGISPHTFRHTAATHMARRGVPLWTIANILGNSVNQVEKVYAKWQADAARDAVNQISSVKG